MFRLGLIMRYIGYAIILCLLLYPSISFSQNDLELVFSPQDISKRLTEVAAKIDQDYQGEELTLVMILKGSIVLTADLMRQLKTPLVLEYIKATRHDANGLRTEKLRLEGIEKLEIKGRNILLIDDACGTGETLSSIIHLLEEQKPKSLKCMTAILFVKNGKRNGFQPDYWLYTLEDRYIVGYGIDHKQHFRNLPGIYELKNYE